MVEPKPSSSCSGMLTTQHPSFPRTSNGYQNLTGQPSPMQHYPGSLNPSHPQQSTIFPSIQAGPAQQQAESLIYRRPNAPLGGPGA